jgi:hypothetical protein
LQDAEVISSIDEKKLQIAKERVSKYLDKLHASRTALESNPDNPLIIQISKEIAEKNGINTETNKE